MLKRKINGGRISKYDENKNLLKGDVNIKKLRCSPKKKGKKNNFSCYTDESLYKLRNLWNMRHPDVVINTNDTKEIHTKLKNILGGVCNKESCWLKQQFAEGKIRDDLENSFAPELLDHRQ